MKCLFILPALTLLCSCILYAAPETAIDVLNSIPEIQPPLELDDSLFWAVDTMRKFQDKEFELLKLIDIVNPEIYDNFTYIPFGKLSLHEKYVTLFLYEYLLDGGNRGYLVNFTKEGELVKELEAYYWNPEGATGTSSSINTKKEITVRSYNIYVNDGEPEVKVLIINDAGHFIPK